MRIKLGYIGGAAGAIIALLGFFGVPITWEEVMDALVVIDQFIINHTAYPGLFVLGLVMMIGFWVMPPAMSGLLSLLLYNRQFDQFSAEFNDLASERKKFWLVLEKLNDAYCEHRPQEIRYSLDTLIQLASHPRDLPLGKKQSISAYSMTINNDLTNESSILWDFVLSIYEEKSKKFFTAKGHDFFESQLLDDIDDLRRFLAKFWNGWGSKIARRINLLPRKRIEDFLMSDAQLLKALTYLEVANAATEIRKNISGGKRFLFQLSLGQNPDGDEADWKQKARRL